MFEIDVLPRAVGDSLTLHGVDGEQILLCVHADRSREHTLGDVYLLATEEKLILLHGALSVSAHGETDRASVHIAAWKETEYEEIPIAELKDFKVEELLSGGRLTAKRKQGDEELPVFLASFTNFCKESMHVFAKYAGKISAGEALEIDPKDDPMCKQCPKCGLRYPDLNRKVCPHCMEKGKLFARFSVFLLRYKGYLIFSVLSLVLMSAMSILAPYLSSGFFYDEVIYGVGEFAGELLLVLGLIISTAILKMIATMFNNYLTSVIAAKVVFDLKKTIFTAIERLSLGFFTGRQTGGLMTQVNEDANVIYSFFCDAVPSLLINGVQVIVVSILLFTIQPVLAIFSLLTVPAFLVLMRYLFRRQRMLHAKRYSHSRRMNGFLADVFSGIRVVKAFSGEEAEIRRFTGRNTELAESEKKLSLFTNFSWPAAHQLLAIGTVVAWALGGWMIIESVGGMSYGKLLTFIAYMGMIFSPLEFFVGFLDTTANCSNSMQRLFEIMDAEPEVCEREDAISPERLGGEIVFSHVSFSYQKGKKIIDDVSFEIPEGHVLGIVGHTGAGKSTLANLLMRLYEVEDGEIRIGGYPVKDLKLSSIYNHVAIVSQETYLFIGSILDNIRYARADATYEEVVEAARCAGAHDFIMKLPDAYHTRIGFGYQDLSGGERQRISIARAILKNPRILILDEATAAMDNETERRIAAAIDALTEGRTTISIAHRLSTLRGCNKIMSLSGGRIGEMGTREELLEKGGVFARLYHLQNEQLLHVMKGEDDDGQVDG